MTDDELLCAFLDGALNDDEMAAVETRLENDALFAARLDRMAKADEAVRSAFAGVLDAPVPDQLTAAARGMPVASNDNRRRWWLGTGAVAASLVAALFAFAPDANRQGVDAALIAALETTPSSTSAAIPGKGKMTPQVSFVSTDGSYCRQFVVSIGDKEQFGLACRGDAGWDVKALGKQQAAGNGYATAGGGEDVDAAAAERRAGDPLSPQGEAELIARGWAG